MSKRILFQKFRSLPNGWLLASILFAILISIPLLSLFGGMFSSPGTAWPHITQNLLTRYVTNTMLLSAGVGLLTLFLGVGSAWLISSFDFPLRNFFSASLILPIAIPAYISGFAWAGLLDYTSPLYVFLRNNFGIDTGTHLFFNILSLPGAIFVLSMALTPYVFLITRTAFEKQSVSLLEAGASLGRGPWYLFFRLALPLARPAIVAGVSLALMEVLNEYGLVKYYGVDTFTTGIFTAWFSFSSAESALRLSSYLMLVVLFLMLAEQYSRRKMRYDAVGTHYRPLTRRRLKGISKWISTIFCLTPLAGGFIIPAGMLVYWSTQTFTKVANYRFWELLGNSFLLASIAAIAVLFAAILIAYTLRSFPSAGMRILSKLSTLGYALPGAVVAIGILIPFLKLDDISTQIMGLNLRYILTGTWVLLIFAYLARFMAVGYNSVESGLERISPSIDEASRSLGISRLKTLLRINLPLLKSPMLSAFLLVFMDVLKELPLTLILRPFNFDTLAIRAFEFASDERMPEAAPAALIIILAGMIPLIFLNRLMKSKKNQATHAS